MQQLDNQVVEREKEIIADLAGLSGGTEIALNDSGWTSRVYIINSGEIVFKFPREEHSKQEYELEIAAYELARKAQGDVLIPEVCWTHPDQEYLGYRGVIGTPLHTVISTLDPKDKARIGADLGTFLGMFHHLDIDGAPLMDQDREFEEYAEKLKLGLPELQRHLTETELTDVRRLILEEYPHRMRELGFQEGLCHGDLGLWNVIYREDGRVGIIDFGDVGYFDTSVDFAGMSDGEVRAAALEAYGGPVMREKIALRMQIMPVLDLPFFIGKGDRGGVARTVERIREVSLV